MHGQKLHAELLFHGPQHPYQPVSVTGMAQYNDSKQRQLRDTRGEGNERLVSDFAACTKTLFAAMSAEVHDHLRELENKLTSAEFLASFIHQLVGKYDLQVSATIHKRQAIKETQGLLARLAQQPIPQGKTIQLTADRVLWI